MGMYTEIRFFAEMRKDVPSEVVSLLNHMLGADECPALPDHPFFKCDRWGFVLSCDSCSFDADTGSTLRWDDIASAYMLTSQANLKNYDGEIYLFLDWIRPYVRTTDGQFHGYYRYEDDEWPTLIHSTASGWRLTDTTSLEGEGCVKPRGER